MRTFLRRFVWAVLFVSVLFSSPSAYAQGTDLSTLRGTVTDTTGAVIPNATVLVKDVGTGITRTFTTNDEGIYEASGLKSGNYLLTVSAAGFNSLEIRGVALRSGESARADAKLAVGNAAEAVTVSSEASPIQTDSPVISGTLNNTQLIQLPRDSRDIYSFLYLNPNITQGASDGAFKFIGAQSYGASFSLDGQRSNGGVFGEPTNSQPSLETLGELTVLSNSFSAEYAGIANIRVVTKRGGSDYHGSLFYNNKNSALAAWDLRDKIGQARFLPTPSLSKYPTPYFNLNEFGGSFGGPIPKFKNTFFFAAYERRLQNSPVNLTSTTLPHPSLWTGDFSRLNNANKPLVPAGVTLTASEIAQNTVGGAGLRFTSLPQRLINPTTSALIQKYFPPASASAGINPVNGRMTDFYTNVPGQIRRHLGTIRVDHDFSERDRMYAVYNTQENTQATAAVVSPFIGLGLTQNERSNHTLSVSETHLFSSNLINEARGGFNSQPTFRRSNQTLREFLTNIGFNDADLQAYGAVIGGSAIDSFGHPAINFGTGLQTFANGGRNTYRPLDQNLFTFGDTLTWIKGRHSIKAGADFVRNQALDGFTSGRGNPRGLITYTGAGTDGFARFLMGLPANSVSYVNQFRPPMDVHNWEHGFFVLDDFKIHPRLTLNLGLRYEIITPFIEANDLLVNFDPTFVSPTGRKGRFVIPSDQTLKSLDPRFIAYGYTTAEKLGLPRSLVKADYNNLAPRLGAAWRVTDRMVLRGGYGIFYPTSAAQGIRDPLATNSFQVGLTKVNRPDAPLSGWPGAQHGISPLTGGTLNQLSGQISGNWVPFDLQLPRIQQYNVTFERDLGWQTALRVSYLGSKMSGLISGSDANMIPPNNTPYGTTTGDGITACSPDDGNCDLSAADRARLPYPELSDYLTSFRNFGRGRSHAFQVEGNKRMSGGFTFNVSYTLLDQKSSAPDTGNSSLGGTAYNQFQPEADFGDDAFTSRHRFISYGIVQSPYGRGRRYGTDIPRWMDLVAGGWELSWQMFAKTGTGFTPFWTCDNCGPFFPGNIASSSIDATGSFNYTAFRPVVTGDPNVKSGDRIFSPDAFAAPPTGADLFDNPNVAIRHLLRGPGTWGLNTGFRKVFRVGERIQAELGADINNLLNHPLKSPNDYELGNLGSFTMSINPTTLQPRIAELIRNPNFGRLITSYTQEGVDSRRTVRLRLRVTF
jgi:hypothetical protein